MSTAFLESLTSHPLIIAVGWTLVHFVWQAAIVALIVALVFGMMRHSSARLRYSMGLVGLAVMTLLPIGTFVYFLSISGSDDWKIQSQFANVELPVIEHKEFIPQSNGEIEFSHGPINTFGWPPDEFTDALPTGAEVDEPEFSNAAVGWPSRFDAFTGTMQLWLPLLVVVWIAGVFCLAVRMLIGLHRVGRWRREGKELRSGDLLESVSRLTKLLDIRRPVRVLETVRVAVPVVIGWIRPAILVPASMLTGLSPAELNSILAHELAHIRRYDYLVNLLQTVVETFLFYHPAVWWLSHRIRAERENCCDDIAIEACGNRVVFARALAHMEEIRCCNEPFALAANGGSLIGRIRRIVGHEPVSSGPWWPAGAIVLGSLGMLLGGLWMTSVSADPVPAEEDPIVVSDETPSKAPERPEDDYNLKKSEVRKIDPKTGIEKRLFADIKLESGEDKRQHSSMDMMYSNVMMYSFIPARIAKQLGATELGEIDFGAEPLPARRAFQAMHDPEAEAAAKAAAIEARRDTVEVHELTERVAEGKRVVPYTSDAVWIPGHLGFYGMNQTKQHVFRIVRIEKVDLGVGPAFGPVNALVLDDANSDFGVLGINWVQQVRGEKGEGLWFDFTGTFHFMATPEHLKTDEAQSDEGSVAQVQEPGTIKIESSGHSETPARLDRDGVNVLASHTYPENYRESTGWVEVNGAQSPIDVGVEHSGVIIYKTLMYDIVAVDSKTKKTIWHIDWGKTMPMWKTVSIVELDRNGEPELAVELYAVNEKTRELVYEYRSLMKGDKLELPVSTVDKPGSLLEQEPDASSDLCFQVVEKDDERTTRVAISAFGHGRSATALVRHFSAIDQDISKFRGGVSTTNMETIVSAADTQYLVATAMEAQEIIFNLPEGSGLRAEFSGENVEVLQNRESNTVVITNGRLELIDAGGVIRAWASPDGGAEQLVVDCKQDLGEVVMVMKTRRIKPFPDYPNPPVQAVMNTETGAPKDEEDPPHGGIRYEIQEGKDDGKSFVRMKMKWRYDLKRLAEEAVAESGLTLEELISGKDDDQPLSDNPDAPPDPKVLADYIAGLNPKELDLNEEYIRKVLEEQSKLRLPSPWLPEPAIDPGLLRELIDEAKNRIDPVEMLPQIQRPQEQTLLTKATPENPEVHGDASGWGSFAWNSGLRSRLTLQSESSQIGQPLVFTLEVKNFGDEATEIDPQRYEPFRVLRVENEDFSPAAPFIGMTPQTSGQKMPLQPGETKVLWSDVDATELFLLAEEKDYFIFAEGGEWAMQALWQDSNRIKVNLAPGDLPSLQSVVADLLPKLLADWKLSMGFGAIFLSHEPTNLKKDVTSIQLFFVDEAGAKKLMESERPAMEITIGLGSTVLGEAFLIAPADATNLWRYYKDQIENSISKIRLPQVGQPEKNQTDVHDKEKPWSVSGTVTDAEGKPLANVTVKAHCGFGTLFNTGSGATDDDGYYEFTFGPGGHGGSPKMVQAATISVSMDGFTEKNLHRQGDCIAALEKPDEINWGDRTEEHLFLPDRPREINFVMVPAVSMQGRVYVGDSGKPAHNYSVSLTGPELPPSSSVIDQVKVADDGSFEINDIPTGFPFQLLVSPEKRRSPWNAWASPPMEFVSRDSGHTHIKYVHDGKPVDFSFQYLYLTLHGEGTNWKTALKDAAEEKLKLTWDGLSTDEMISAGMAFLDLGEK